MVITSLRKLPPPRRVRVIKAIAEMLDAMTLPARYISAATDHVTVDDIVARKLAALTATDTSPDSTSSPPTVGPEPTFSAAESQTMKRRRAYGKPGLT
jgi:hypothetical protein